MKKICTLIFLGLLLNSCGYYCYVSSIGSAPQSKSYCILPNNANLVGDLEFKQYANMLATALNRVGYRDVPEELADIIVYFDWTIGNITNETIVVQNNYNTTYSPTPTKSFTISFGEKTQTTTTTGFTSSQTTYTSYNNEYAPLEVHVVAVDKKTKQQIWKTTIHDDLEYDKTTLSLLMPVMLYAGSKHFGEAADGRVDLSQSEVKNKGIMWPY